MRSLFKLIKMIIMLTKGHDKFMKWIGILLRACVTNYYEKIRIEYYCVLTDWDNQFGKNWSWEVNESIRYRCRRKGS